MIVILSIEPYLLQFTDCVVCVNNYIYVSNFFFFFFFFFIIVTLGLLFNALLSCQQIQSNLVKEFVVSDQIVEFIYI